MATTDRIEKDGSTWMLRDSSAHERIDNLKSALSTKTIWNENNNNRKPNESTLLDISKYSFFQGSITGDTGVPRVTNTRISSEMIYIDNIWMIDAKTNSGYKYFITEYDNGGKFIKQTSFYTENINYTSIRHDEYIRVSIAKSDDTDISVSEANAAFDHIRLYKHSQNDLQQSRTNAKGWQAVQFTYGAESKTLRRATSGHFVFDDCIVENIGEQPNLVSIRVDVKDKDYNVIEALLVSGTQAIQSLCLHKSDIPTGKYFSIYAGNAEDDSADLTSEMLDYLNASIFIHPYEPVELKSLTEDDFWLCRNQSHDRPHFENDYYFQARISTKKIYRNIGQIITNQNTSYSIYARYYDENFKYAKDTNWNERYIDTSEEAYPYFRLFMKKGFDIDLTSEDITALVESINVNGVLLAHSTLRGTDGAIITGVGAIRCATYPYRWIDDAYIKFHNIGIDAGIVAYNSNKEMIGEYGWFTYSSEIGRTDKAIRLQNCYVRFYFAKQDRTAGFEPSDCIALQNGILDGSFLEIVDAIHPHAIGEQAKDGYPSYYTEEMKQTVSTIGSKVNNDSVVFAMITDLHDNDPDHYSEVLKYQLEALRNLKEKARLDFVICGGDLTDGAFTQKANLLEKFTDHRQNFTQIGIPSLFVRGNHDDNSYFSKVAENCVLKADFYSRLIMNEAGNKRVNGKAYYYHDFEELNLRVICLDFIDYPEEIDENGYLKYYAVGGDNVWRGYSDDQITWLAGTALNTNKRIIITGHYSTHRNLMSTWEKSVEHNWDEVNKAMIAYQSRGSYAFDGQTYNFAGKTGKILAQVTGHSHSFGAFKENGIVWSTTGSPSTDVTHRTYDNTQYETMGSRAYGDITEAHFNMFVCDDSNVHIISFGQMGDLDFTV